MGGRGGVGDGVWGDGSGCDRRWDDGGGGDAQRGKGFRMMGATCIMAVYVSYQTAAMKMKMRF